MNRTGSVALVGRANVGKSTFLNAALGEPLAAVSSRPQTTRDTLLGIVNWKDAEIALIDTPGIHNPRNKLGQRMNAAAMASLRSADLVVMFLDAAKLLRGSRSERLHAASASIEERHLVSAIPQTTPCILVLNKIDKLVDKQLLLPLLCEFDTWRASTPIIPVCCLRRDDVERVLDEIAHLLPAGSRRFSPDTLTNRPVKYFVAEYIREQVMQMTFGEIPFAVAVRVDEFVEYPSITLVKATLCVEKDGQRVILIGRGGRQIREIGIRARKRIEQLLCQKVQLELFVRTQTHWRDTKTDLDELGYGELDSAVWDCSKLPTRRGRT